MTGFAGDSPDRPARDDSVHADPGSDALHFEVTQRPPGQDTPPRTIADAAGVAVLVREAAARGIRVHIRPRRGR